MIEDILFMIHGQGRGVEYMEISIYITFYTETFH